jgi:hypothetical protein
MRFAFPPYTPAEPRPNPGRTQVPERQRQEGQGASDAGHQREERRAEPVLHRDDRAADLRAQRGFEHRDVRRLTVPGQRADISALSGTRRVMIALRGLLVRWGRSASFQTFSASGIFSPRRTGTFQISRT